MSGARPQYRWYGDGRFQELLPPEPFAFLSMPPRGTYVVVWNDFTGSYEMGISNGTTVERIWDREHLPAEFRLRLLLLDVHLP